ncbi:MAG: hypothetical protein WKF76_09770 [Nocardioidaceae bacterium]
MSVFAPALRAVVDKGELELAVDPDTLMSRSKRILSELPSRAVSAKVVFRNNRPTIRPSRDGVTVSPQAWVAGVQRAYVKTGDRRTATVKTTIDEPRFSTRQVRRLGIRSLVATKAVTYTDGGREGTRPSSRGSWTASRCSRVTRCSSVGGSTGEVSPALPRCSPRRPMTLRSEAG